MASRNSTNTYVQRLGPTKPTTKYVQELVPEKSNGNEDVHSMDHKRQQHEYVQIMEPTKLTNNDM